MATHGGAPRQLRRPIDGARSVGEALREHLEEALARGEYPRGSWLPSVRELSAILDVNRNTVSRVYQWLERDGMVRRVPGRGMAVVALRPRRAAGRRDDLHDDALELVRRAHDAGVTTERLYDLVRGAEAFVRAESRVRVALVECNEEAAASLATKLSEGLRLPVSHLLLSEAGGLKTPDRPDVLVTTFFHLNELSATQDATHVVGVRHEMSYATLTAISGLRPDRHVVVVCPNERTLGRVETAVRSYTRCAVVPTLAERREELETALERADAAVVAWGTRAAVERLRPDLPLIVVEYEIDAQSIAEVRSAVAAVVRRLPARMGTRRRAPSRLRAPRRRTGPVRT